MNIQTAHITSHGRAGYHCVEHSSGLEPGTVSLLERRALPYGSEWVRLIGARSIKAFPLGSGRTAVSCTRVTSSRDDSGRTGVLDCYCAVVTVKQFGTLLTYPEFLFDAIRGQDRRQLDDILQVECSAPPPEAKALSGTRLAALRIRTGRRVKITHKYSGSTNWIVVENAMRALLLSLPRATLGKVSFATLTLSEADSMQMFAQPT